MEVLPPIITALHAAYPELVIELMPSNRMEDLLQREADIAVRMQRPSQGVLIARRIGNVELGLYAHKRYLERRGKPANIDELANHALIGFDKETAFIRSMKPQLPELRREIDGVAHGQRPRFACDVAGGFWYWNVSGRACSPRP